MKKSSFSRSAFVNPRVLISLFKTIAMAIGVLLLILQAGSAQIQNSATPDYDAVRDFSIISNPTEVWSYGWQSSLGSPLNLYTVTDTTSVSGMSAWLEFGTIATPPLVAHNDTSNKICFFTLCVPPTYLLLHPGPNNEVTVVRWAAPSSGRFCVQGAVAGLDYAFPTTTSFYEVLNSNRILFSATIDSYSSPLLFRHVLTVSTGDTVDFAVDFGQDGNYSGDSTGIQFKVTEETSIAIDIKPGTFPNSINPRGKGVIPVAILTTDTFDATAVDPTTVRFGPNGTEAAPVQSALEDVDGDGDTDMILHFKTQDTGIVCGDASASLTGETFSGEAIEGSDSIQTVGCK